MRADILGKVNSWQVGAAVLWISGCLRALWPAYALTSLLILTGFCWALPGSSP
jgi:hypothetical protein